MFILFIITLSMCVAALFYVYQGLEYQLSETNQKPKQG